MARGVRNTAKGANLMECESIRADGSRLFHRLNSLAYEIGDFRTFDVGLITGIEMSQRAFYRIISELERQTGKPRDYPEAFLTQFIRLGKRLVRLVRKFIERNLLQTSAA